MTSQPRDPAIDHAYARFVTDIIRHAIARRDADETFTQEAYRRYRGVEAQLEPQLGLDDGSYTEVRRWEEWLNLVQQAEGESEAHLIRVVLAASDDASRQDFHDAEMRAFPPRAVIDGDRLFVAYPTPDDDDIKPFERHPRDKDQVVMRLLIAPLADLADLRRQASPSAS